MKLAAGTCALLLAVTAGSAVYAQGYGGGGGYGDYDSPPPAASPSGAVVAQLRTARTHAANAAGSEVMAGVLDHLAHVVNCLEGSRGANYNARADNPCRGQGGGVIPDLQAESARGQMGAASALASAREADRIAVDTLKVTDMARAKTDAARVADLLGQALRAIGQ